MVMKMLIRSALASCFLLIVSISSSGVEPGTQMESDAVADAAGLLNVVQNVSLGRTTNKDLKITMERYRRYLVNVGGDYAPDTTAYTYRIIGGVHGRVTFAVTLVSSNQRIISRLIGMSEDDCCSIELKQTLGNARFKKRSGSQIKQAIIKDPNYISLDVSPFMNRAAFAKVTLLKVDCLSREVACSNIDTLAPNLTHYVVPGS